MTAYFRQKSSVRFGTGFGESIGKNQPYRIFSAPRVTGIGLRTVVPVLLLVGCFLLLFGRLAQLTIARGVYFKELSDTNRIREERILAPRGVIYARGGEVLAGNRPVYRECQTADPTICRVISRDDALEKEARGQPIQYALGRDYREATTAAHLVGYMTAISPEELTSRNEVVHESSQTAGQFCQYCYGPDELIGASGAEEIFETLLRGTPGKRMYEVDVNDVEIDELARIEPMPGSDIHLALDLPLQRIAADALERMRADDKVRAPGGAVIATDPKTGEILALYSSPAFDPNVFVGVGDDPDRMIRDIFTTPAKPLFNRALSGLYAPGSTFKIIIAAAGLEERVIDGATTIEDTGVIRIGPYSYTNWLFTKRGQTDDEVTIIKALQRSNDIFFYKLGEMVGIEAIEKWAGEFGVTAPIETELSEGTAGIIRRDREWFLGDTYHVAIGQGDVQVTPLHVNSWMQTIANDGEYCPPTITRKQGLGNREQNECTNIGLSEKTIQLITEGLKAACTTGGTAWPLFRFQISDIGDQKREIELACKTGTAEFGHPEDKTHAWLTAFAPADDPEIVVTVLIEEGGEGSDVAAPVVKDILTEWFSRKR